MCVCRCGSQCGSGWWTGRMGFSGRRHQLVPCDRHHGLDHDVEALALGVFPFVRERHVAVALGTPLPAGIVALVQHPEHLPHAPVLIENDMGAAQEGPRLGLLELRGFHLLDVGLERHGDNDGLHLQLSPLVRDGVDVQLVIGIVHLLEHHGVLLVNVHLALLLDLPVPFLGIGVKAEQDLPHVLRALAQNGGAPAEVLGLLHHLGGLLRPLRGGLLLSLLLLLWACSLNLGLLLLRPLALLRGRVLLGGLWGAPVDGQDPLHTVLDLGRDQPPDVLRGEVRGDALHQDRHGGVEHALLLGVLVVQLLPELPHDGVAEGGGVVGQVEDPEVLRVDQGVVFPAAFVRDLIPEDPLDLVSQGEVLSQGW
eukprot:RCo010834